AADGIRVRNVTGVQTCALPISREQLHRALQENNGYRFTGAAVGRGDLPGPLGHDLLLRLPREPAGIEHPRVPPVARVVVRGEEGSGESRVGEEGSSRWTRGTEG